MLLLLGLAIFLHPRCFCLAVIYKFLNTGSCRVVPDMPLFPIVNSCVQQVKVFMKHTQLLFLPRGMCSLILRPNSPYLMLAASHIRGYNEQVNYQTLKVL